MNTFCGWLDFAWRAARGMMTAWCFLMVTPGGLAADPGVLPGSDPLTLEGDMASNLVAGVDRFLSVKLEASVDRRTRHWRRDFTSAEAYQRSVEPNRERLRHITGVRDQRVEPEGLEYISTTRQPALRGRGPGYEIWAVRWPVFGPVHGEGLLLMPTDRAPVADVIAVPDADQTPEQWAGIEEGLPGGSQMARRLAESGCRVVVPALVSRQLSKRNGRANLTHREFVYRSAFELGRHLIGYEVQKILALVDGFESERSGRPVGIIGYGEGGGLALYAAALDGRLQTAWVSGYFDSRQDVWQEPIDRNVFGLLDAFGDAELASLVAPRRLVIEAARAPEIDLPSEGGAPGRLRTPPLQRVRAEFDRAQSLIQDLTGGKGLAWAASEEGAGPFGTDGALAAWWEGLGLDQRAADSGRMPQPTEFREDATRRQARMVAELDLHNQWLLGESASVRSEFMKQLDTRSTAQYEASSAWYREYFKREVIGWFDDPLLPPRPRTRKAYETAAWTGYEVVLDVFPDVIAYGILLVPRDARAGERRPVVVCQHGLEGRPQDVVAGDHRAYHDFAAALAERGFVTFAPQNLYLFGDRFRTLQRKANPLGKTLFSIITPQHQQMVNWLKSLPWVDPERIAFYGLSYGGKTAMRVPALVTDYCLSICSADFNEWVWKNASTRSPYSYVWTGEYEIFEFDLGSTFNYAEMAALIAPRPFMVERGHFDGVAPDEAVAYEFAKVRHLYAARLGIPERGEIEWFVGPHTIHGKGTFEFLHRHLNWPGPTTE